MISRREALKGLGLLTGATLLGREKVTGRTTAPESNFSYCLNTSTISGQQTGFLKEFEITARAGYNGIEIWVRDLEKYIQEGQSLKDLKKYVDDLGLSIENAIGFAQWAVNDESTRKAGMEQLKREMEMLAEIGCKRIAAPPAGATSSPMLNLFEVARRYRTVLELGDQIGVLPQLEIWGSSANLFHISQALFVASATGHPKACILPDVYHMFRGGSPYESLKLMSESSIEMFHFNDFVDSIPREEQKDSDRVYPGDGAAPFNQIVKYLKKSGGKKVLSLELFNPEYWDNDAFEVAKTGLMKMKQVVAENS
ncbi:MAG: sugar phosphate isomerase/epimerase family protein [Bacteroidota bacterium]